jgi:hypothetical protein
LPLAVVVQRRRTDGCESESGHSDVGRPEPNVRSRMILHQKCDSASYTLPRSSPSRSGSSKKDGSINKPFRRKRSNTRRCSNYVGKAESAVGTTSAWSRSCRSSRRGCNTSGHCLTTECTVRRVSRERSRTHRRVASAISSERTVPDLRFCLV